MTDEDIENDPVSDTPEMSASDPSILGYRKLTQDEVSQINLIKMRAQQTSLLISHFHSIIDDEDNKLLIDEHCVSIAASFLQTGFMWLTRSVTKPDAF